MTVQTHTDGAVSVVTIDRPAVLTGGGGTFCAGADLHAMTDPARRNRLERDDGGPRGPRVGTRTSP